MKTFQLIFFSLILISSLQAQNLSINNLIKLSQLNSTESQKFLSDYKWVQKGSTQNDPNLSLSFQYYENGALKGLLTKTFDENLGKVFLSFFDRVKLNIYVDELRTLGFSKKKSYIEDEKIIDVYQKGNLRLDILSRPNQPFVISVSVSLVRDK